jgi:Family of unknown function (DUF6788)
MQKTTTVQAIDEKILHLKRQLLALGPLHPGSLSRQYHVCGKSGCKCTAPHKPQPHGPYTKLTYAHHGQFTCRFVRAEVVPEVTALVATFKTFRQLTDQWIQLAIQRAQLGPLRPGARQSKPRPSARTPRQG